MEKVKEYVNKDLSGLSFEDFCKMLSLGVNFQELSTLEKIEWALLILDFKSSPIRMSEAMTDYNLKVFDGVCLLTERLGGGVKDLYYDPLSYEINPSLFDNKIESKVMNFKEDTISLSRWKTLPIEAKRGICLPHETLLSFQYAYVTNKDKWFTFSSNYKAANLLSINNDIRTRVLEELEKKGIRKNKDISINGKTYSWDGFVKSFYHNKGIIPVPSKAGYSFKDSDVKDYLSSDSYKDIFRSYNMAISFQFTHHFEWHIYIKEHENSIGFQVPVNPSCYKDIFSLRDVEKGKRKKAILHFVKDHYRTIQNSDNETNEVLVKKYLRGETDFNWNGLKVSLIPSKSDIINTKSKKKFLNV